MAVATLWSALAGQVRQKSVSIDRAQTWYFSLSTDVCLVWLNLFNAELSPKRYCLGPRYQEVGEEEDNYTYRYTITTRMTPALKWAAVRDI